MMGAIPDSYAGIQQLAALLIRARHTSATDTKLVRTELKHVVGAA